MLDDHILYFQQIFQACILSKVYLSNDMTTSTAEQN